jgi:hypothetical protein
MTEEQVRATCDYIGRWPDGRWVHRACGGTIRSKLQTHPVWIEGLGACACAEVSSSRVHWCEKCQPEPPNQGDPVAEASITPREKETGLTLEEKKALFTELNKSACTGLHVTPAFLATVQVDLAPWFVQVHKEPRTGKVGLLITKPVFLNESLDKPYVVQYYQEKDDGIP